MYLKPFTWILALSSLSLVPEYDAGGSGQQTILFATYAGQRAELRNTVLLTRSIRTFAGSLQQSPVWIYAPPELIEQEQELAEELLALGVVLKTSTPPAEATWYHYAGKVFAAAAAEEAAVGNALLAWLDEDTILLQQPDQFLLPAGKCLGYRPVMHRNICPPYEEPLDDFWERAFRLMSVDQSCLFPMTTPAFRERVRPYFNAGCLIVRPERGLLREWVGYFTILYRDPHLRESAQTDIRQRIFLHQVALTGAFLNNVSQDEMLEFSERVNFPLFFDKMFGADRPFEDITEVITLRHESFFRNGSPDWLDQLQGPPEKVNWIRVHLPPGD